MAEEWSQQLMKLSDFIDSVLEASPPPPPPPAAEAPPSAPAPALGYLAQHPLFEQIPVLRADILVPDYTALGSDADVRACAVEQQQQQQQQQQQRQQRQQQQRGVIALCVYACSWRCLCA
jgi:hypothetical protein